MLYEKMKSADKSRDIDAFMELVHDDFVFVRNQNGTDVDRTGFYEGRKMMYASDKVTREKERCIYENDDILVQHMKADYANGTKDATMHVSLKKDGLLWRTETGVTSIKT